MVTKQAFLKIKLHTKVYLDSAETEPIDYYLIEVKDQDGGLIDDFDFGTLVIYNLMDRVLVGIISDLLGRGYDVVGDKKAMVDLIERVKKVKGRLK